LFEETVEEQDPSSSGSSVDREQLFASALAQLANRLSDPMPRVQAAALSALCVLSDFAGENIIPHLHDLFSVIHQCFPVYGVKCTMQLFDLIGTVADNVGESMCEPTLSPLYLPHIMTRLRSTADTDMYLFPVLECLTSVTSAAGIELAPYAAEIVDRCIRIANTTMIANAAAETGATEEDSAPVKDFAICGIDVLAGLCEGLTLYFGQLCESRADEIVSLLLSCSGDCLPELRQSSLVFIGEIAKNAPSLLTPHARTRLMEVVLLNLLGNEECLTVCSNAVWSLGEMVVQVQYL
jgi:transportin-1